VAELYKPANVLGKRYSITIEAHYSIHSGDGFSATMTCRGRKKAWCGYGKTAEAAKSSVLRYIDTQLHPFVNVTVKGA
jgi:hypothetical protein